MSADSLPRAASTEKQPHERARILVIDDDPRIRSSLARLLRQVGYEVICAEDGEIAIELLEKSACDLVITDVVMPNQEGVETCMVLRERWPDLPFIAVSGSTNPIYLKLMANLGARATFQKPVSPRELIGAVNEVLSGRVV